MEKSTRRGFLGALVALPFIGGAIKSLFYKKTLETFSKLPDAEVIRILPIREGYYIELREYSLRYIHPPDDKLYHQPWSRCVASVPTPYRASELPGINYTVHGGGIIIVHPNHPPMRLEYTFFPGDGYYMGWQLNKMTWTPSIV
jgi:hypothetical protein